jgi:hypothetical protein
MGIPTQCGSQHYFCEAFIEQDYPKCLLYFGSNHMRYLGFVHVWHEETIQTAITVNMVPQFNSSI